MSLSRAQQEFAQHIADLIHHIQASGHACTFGDAYRDPRVHGKYGEKKSYSSANSNHKRRLAVDLNLFRDGVFLTATDSHAEFGAYWEALHEHNRWGGRYDDGNHYERVYGGWK